MTEIPSELSTARARVAELEAEVRQRNAELAIVNEVAEALARQLDFDSIMAAVGERAAQALDAAGLSIAMRDPDTDQVRFLYWLDEGVRKPELQGRVLDDVLTARIIASGRPIRVGSADEAAAIGAPFKVEGTESYLGVPIPTGHETIGVIAIGTSEQQAYGPDDERFLSTLATNMGVALDNARLLTEQALASAEIRRQKQYFETLVEISPVAVMTMDRGEIVSGWNPAATRLLGYEPAEAIGRHIDDLVFRPEDRDEGRDDDPAGRGARAGPAHRAAAPQGRRARRRRDLPGPAHRRRRAHRLLRDLPRHHRAPGGTPRRRCRERGEEHVPGVGEPRDPDTR